MASLRRVLLALVLAASALPAAAQSLSVAVPAPDGTPLATDVYLPGLLGHWPVVLMRTPYGKAGMRDTCLAFAALGYACVAQDTRGRFASGGSDTVFRDDGDDGRATVQWIAGQWWCDGAVGTFGGSALGITQYMLAPGAAPVLRCIVPSVGTTDLYDDAFMPGGALREGLTVNWLAGQGSLGFLDEMLAHRLHDSWWDPVDVTARAAEVHAAGLHIGGWYDIFQQGTLDAYRTLQHDGGDGARGRQYLVMGPWTHALGSPPGQLTYPDAGGEDLVGRMVAFYGHWLRGEDAGVDQWPAVWIYLMGAVGEPGAPGNRWIALTDWPPPGVRERSWYLDATGGLSAAPAAAGAVTLAVDPADPVPTLGGANLFAGLEVAGRQQGAGPYDQRPVEARADVLSFTSRPLALPLTITGRIRAELWVDPDTPDLDLAVRLTDVYPDGRSMLVTDGIARARYRCGADRECVLSPGVPAEIVVDLWSTALVVNAGHRLRLDVSGSNWPRFEVNPNSGGDLGGGSQAIPAHPDLLTGPGHPSRLVLPVLPPSVPRFRGARPVREVVAER